MNRKLFYLGAILSITQAKAQNYQKLSLYGFNADVIANGVGAATNSTTSSLDKDSDNFAFISKDFKLNSSSNALTYGLPENGLVNSVVAATNGLSYQLASYSANNSLRLPNANDNGTLTLQTPYTADTLYVLAVSGSGSSTGEITVNFQDGTTEVFPNINFSDWYDGNNFAIQGIGRINRSSNTLDAGGGTNPRVYQISLSLNALNQSKPIVSVAFKKTSTSVAVMNIFAITAQTTQLSVSDTKSIRMTEIYPNPFENELNLTNISNILSIDILELSGKMIVQNLHPKPKLNLSFLNKGIYLIVLKKKGGTSTYRKIIKK